MKRRAAIVLLAVGGCAAPVRPLILPEQRCIEYRDPSQLAPARIPDSPTPRTVLNPQPEVKEWFLTLDEAIRIALENARVVRVLAGQTAVASGRTIYDPAVSNTAIDQEQARFDPVFTQNNRVTRTDTPTAIGPRVGGLQQDDYRAEVGLQQTNTHGGTAGLNWTNNPTRFGSEAFSILDPQNRSALELTYTQPLLQGGGFAVNTAPIVIARLNTERSFFQYKDSVQELVRGTIEAYWNIVQARTDVWARKIQVQQSQEAFEREQARLKTGLGDLREVAQARVTFTQFKANLIAAEAAVLVREGALRNILGLPPEDRRTLVPVSPPTNSKLKPNWEEIIRLASERRPDVIELKLVLEADQVRMTQAENQALPRLDAVGLYRWNGLDGRLPDGQRVASDHGQFADWSLGVNFSVPLGLRAGRAQVRQQSLLINRDRANVEQSVHAAVHELALTIRDLDNSLAQYQAFRETRAAALENLIVQIEQFRAQRTIYLNVLQALNDWGNAVTNEARSLTNYNIALATLERQTGTILETHGLVFQEERTRFAGPLGLPSHDRLYPSSIYPGPNEPKYPGGTEPAENSFDLKNPDAKAKKP